jgi:replicative DNA helicase
MNTNDRSNFYSQYERGLLGLIYSHEDLLIEARQLIGSEHFLYEPHRIIFTAMCILSDREDLCKLDVNTVFIECMNLGLKETGVGADYVMLVCEHSFNRSNFKLYLNKVTEAYKKYSLSEVLSDSYNLVSQNKTDVVESLDSEELMDEVMAKISKLGGYDEKDTEAVLVNEVIREYVLEWASDPTSVRGIRTGFNKLDETINGLMPGALTVIAGKAGAGKSTVLLNIAERVAFSNEETVPVYFVSTEMYTKEDAARLLAMRSMIREREISNGIAYQDPKKQELLDKVVNEIENGNMFFHEYMPDFNASKLCSRIQYYKSKYNIGLVIFDYIKLDTTADSGKMRNRREDQILGDLTVALKTTAGKLNIPVLAACQINSRSLNVADSDRILRYCNNLIEFKDKTVEELEQAGDHRKYGTHWLTNWKTRSGGKARTPVRFWKPCNLIQEAEEFIDESGENASEDELPVSVETTTPAEYAKLINESFKIERVESVVQHVDVQEMDVSDDYTIPDDDDPLF